jgi:hypothetical protein
MAVCDRGSLDGIAYWPGSADSFFATLGTTREAEHARYGAVIHLRTPAAAEGYDRRNPVRIESAAEAIALDDRVLAAWDGHPKRIVLESTANFLDKVEAAIAAIRRELPGCCR